MRESRTWVGYGYARGLLEPHLDADVVPLRERVLAVGRRRDGSQQPELSLSVVRVLGAVHRHEVGIPVPRR